MKSEKAIKIIEENADKSWEEVYKLLLKADQEEKNMLSCACCSNKGEVRLKVCFCSECYCKVMQKYSKEKKPYDESDVFAENEYWGFK